MHPPEDQQFGPVDNLIHYHPGNPVRPPDWRWMWTAALLRASVPVGRREDGWVRRARRLLLVLGRFGGDPGYSGVVKSDPACLAAYRLHQWDARRRWELEARLLAGQDDATIAARLAVPGDVVAAYEALFYDVRHRLGGLDWVGAVVFGDRLYDGMIVEDVEGLAKLVGYSLGPRALEAFLDPSRLSPGVASPERDPAGMPLPADRFAALIAVATLRVDESSAPLILRLSARLQELDRAATAGSVAAICRPLTFVPQAGPDPAPAIRPQPRVVPLELIRARELEADDDLATRLAPLRFPVALPELTGFRLGVG